MKLSKLKILTVMLIIAAALVFTACGQEPHAHAHTGVIAIVNGEEIKSETLEQRLDMQVRLWENHGFLLEEEQINEIRENILDDMIMFALLLQAAQNEGLTVTTAEVDDEFNTIRGEFVSEDDFRAALEESDLTESELREFLERDLLIEKLFNHVTGDIAVDEEVLREYFEENREWLIEMQVSHILIPAREGAATPDDRRVARAEAQRLITRLNAGEDFAELAIQYSACPSSFDGGRLEEYITMHDHRFDPLFVNGAYELSAIGDFSQEPVATSFGYHIILVDDKISTFEQLREIIEHNMIHGEKMDVFEAYGLMLYESAEIVNFLTTDDCC